MATKRKRPIRIALVFDNDGSYAAHGMGCCSESDAFSYAEEDLNNAHSRHIIEVELPNGIKKNNIPVTKVKLVQ